jgi:ketosteroid isomerase-like protein
MKPVAILRFALAALCVLLLSCKQETNVAEVRKQIEEADARQVQAFKTKDHAAMLANYAPDAVILPPGGPSVTGREAMDAFFKEMSAMMNDFNFAMTKFDVSGDLAYEVGKYNGVFGSVSDTGKYMTVWKRQADGKWMIVADIFNTDLAPQTPAVVPTK